MEIYWKRKRSVCVYGYPHSFLTLNT
jgi:hypothetical protein